MGHQPRASSGPSPRWSPAWSPSRAATAATRTSSNVEGAKLTGPAEVDPGAPAQFTVAGGIGAKPEEEVPQDHPAVVAGARRQGQDAERPGSVQGQDHRDQGQEDPVQVDSKARGCLLKKPGIKIPVNLSAGRTDQHKVKLMTSIHGPPPMLSPETDDPLRATGQALRPALRGGSHQDRDREGRAPARERAAGGRVHHLAEPGEGGRAAGTRCAPVDRRRGHRPLRLGPGRQRLVREDQRQPHGRAGRQRQGAQPADQAPGDRQPRRDGGDEDARSSPRRTDVYTDGTPTLSPETTGPGQADLRGRAAHLAVRGLQGRADSATPRSPAPAGLR